MKKLIIPVLLFFVMAVGCNRTKSNPNLVDIKLVVINDSVLVQNEFDEAYSRYTMNIDLPVTDNKILRQSIIHWMLSS